jgi:hypothetical protein
MIKRLSIISTAVLAALLIAGLAWAAPGDSSSSSSASTSTTLAQNDPAGSRAATGSKTFEAGTAGQVTVDRSGASLSISDVATNDGWAPEVEVASGREVEVKFINGNERIDFQAELEDGGVKTRVRTRTLTGLADDGQTLTAPSDGVLSFAAGKAGTVQLTATDGTLELISATPSATWTVADVEIEGTREINVEFRSGATEIEFKAEMEDGMVKTRVRTETDNDSPNDGFSNISEGRSDDDSSGPSNDDHEDGPDRSDDGVDEDDSTDD